MQILFQFDIRTVALFMSLTFLVQATAIAAQAYLIRDLRQYRGIRTAVLANVVVAVGVLLRLLIDRYPDFLTIILANMLLLGGAALFYIALGKFMGFSYSKITLGILLIVELCLLLYLTYWQDSLGLRMIVVSIGVDTIVALLVHQLLRTRLTSLRFSANLMLAAFLGFGLFLIVRTVNLILNPLPATFNGSPVQSATFAVMFAFSFCWSIGFILMVSQRLRNDLLEMATTDVLTRIPNRRATQAFLEQELSRLQRQPGEFTILLIDIDHFKQVNDRWGHATGDRVLIQTATIFQSLIRKQDWVGRWGGEEFLMVFPGSVETESLAERIRSEVATARYQSGSESFGITVSIGAACASSEDQIDMILKKADDALYHAKQTRNRVSVAC